MRKILTASLLFVLVVGAGCGGMRPTVFIHDEYNFQFLERVAVIPFDNLSKDQGSGARATRVFIAQLLAAEAFDVVEPGEVSKALEKFSLVRTSELTKEQVQDLGRSLNVQGVFLGSVTEADVIRTGGTTANTITIVARLVETETGATVWSATNTAGGRGFWSSLFGTGDKSQSEVMRECIRTLLGSLVS